MTDDTQRVVGLGSPANGGRHADHDAEGHGHDDRQHGEFGGHREPFGDHFGDGTLLPQRVAEVTAHGIAEPHEVLRDRGLVETELGLHLGHSLRGHRAGVGELEPHDIAGNGSHHEEQEGRQEEEHEEARQDASSDVFDHVTAPVSAKSAALRFGWARNSSGVSP
ncbi:MAG: hypothetical protein R2710_21080 [Acidimicrobiales bacterium]